MTREGTTVAGYVAPRTLCSFCSVFVSTLLQSTSSQLAWLASFTCNDVAIVVVVVVAAAVVNDAVVIIANCLYTVCFSRYSCIHPILLKFFLFLFVFYGCD